MKHLLLAIFLLSTAAQAGDSIDQRLQACANFRKAGAVERLHKDTKKRFQGIFSFPAPYADVTGWKAARDNAVRKIDLLKSACDAERAAASQTGPAHDAKVKALGESGAGLKDLQVATRQFNSKMHDVAYLLERLDEKECSQNLRNAIKETDATLQEQTGRQTTVCQGL